MQKIILTCRVTDKHNIQTMQRKISLQVIKVLVPYFFELDTRYVLAYIGRQMANGLENKESSTFYLLLKSSNSTYFHIPSKKLSCLAHTVFKTHTNSKCNRSAHLKELASKYLSTIEANNSNRAKRCSPKRLQFLRK